MPIHTVAVCSHRQRPEVCHAADGLKPIRTKDSLPPPKHGLYDMQQMD
ncbi:MAG TPA: hypothetical protein PLE00_04910 [Anaerolineaceae bacterium]|nr:hypothetical protein [Anaerolineaceae bacterium]